MVEDLVKTAVEFAERLSAQQLLSYQHDGFVVVRNFFQRCRSRAVLAETEQLGRRPDLVDPNNLRCRFMPDVRGDGKMLFEVFDPIIDLSPACESLARDSRLF